MLSCRKSKHTNFEWPESLWTEHGSVPLLTLRLRLSLALGLCLRLYLMVWLVHCLIMGL